jgi:uncharacterized protein YndB with AHSA1/START domain
MSTVAVTRVVRVPVARAWSVFTDLPARADWLSTVAGVEVLTAGVFGVGTVWRETRTMPDGEQVTEEFRVEECSAPARLVVSSPGAGADYRVTYTFAPVWPRSAVRRRPPRAGRVVASRATAVTVVLDGTPSGSAGRLLAFILGGLAARVVEGTLRQDLTDLAAAAA